jgi:hypothetical protein
MRIRDRNSREKFILCIKLFISSGKAGGNGESCQDQDESAPTGPRQVSLQFPDVRPMPEVWLWPELVPDSGQTHHAGE